MNKGKKRVRKEINRMAKLYNVPSPEIAIISHGEGEKIPWSKVRALVKQSNY